jgi:hypothetical protein
LTIAVGDMEPYTDAAGRPNTVLANINLGGGAIGGLTLTPVSTPLAVDNRHRRS